MQEINMTLHMEPVAKGRPKFARRGKFMTAYTPAKTVKAENNILAQALPHRPATPFQSRVNVGLKFFMTIPMSMSKRERVLADQEAMIHTKKPDLDNLEKTILDALNGVFYRDDSIIWSVTKEKLYSPRPRIEVYLNGE